jgi:enoyl-CoA hydratase/carnithine racemase
LSHIQTEIVAGVGLITLNRPQALNALTQQMIVSLTQVLSDWVENPEVEIVAIRGNSKQGPFGTFCAGGDIRFLHDAAIAGDSALEAFFTAEYRLNHFIYNYPKPYIAFMDGVIMGGGMGLAQGADLRIVSPGTKMAMPETNIGLFPDVGGGYFLSRCPGSSGEYLALTGQMLSGEDALAVGLADGLAAAEAMPDLWNNLIGNPQQRPMERLEKLKAQLTRTAETPQWLDRQIDAIFSLPTLMGIIQALENADNQLATKTLHCLRQRSPLMLHITLEQIRRGRQLSIADELRMERTMVQHCFNPQHLKRSGNNCETVEGIRALVVDKDRNPQWNPSRIEDVTAEMVKPFFDNPWPQGQHPLADLNQSSIK